MVSQAGLLFAVEPNHGELDVIIPGGGIFRIADISNVEGHIVPTALAIHNGNFFIGNLETFPIKASAKVMKITPDGAITTLYIDLQTIVGLAFDAQGRLYVLEMSTDNPNPTPGTGKIVRIDGKNNYTDIATGLSFPTAMTFGSDGNLYVSNKGFGMPAGAGEVVKVLVP
jgi:sugar lactone lactonase YvrE